MDKLKEAIDASGGLIPLAMIKNGKTVDPQDDTSTKVCSRFILSLDLFMWDGHEPLLYPPTLPEMEYRDLKPGKCLIT